MVERKISPQAKFIWPASKSFKPGSMGRSVTGGNGTISPVFDFVWIARRSGLRTYHAKAAAARIVSGVYG